MEGQRRHQTSEVGAGCLTHNTLGLNPALGPAEAGKLLPWGKNKKRPGGPVNPGWGPVWAWSEVKVGDGQPWHREEPEAVDVATSTCSGTKSKGG